MGTYCAPIRYRDWEVAKAEEPWHKVELRKVDTRWILDLLDLPAQEEVIRLEVELSLATDRSLSDRFREQADKWARETRHLSSPTQMMSHPSYQAILGMASENKREVIRLLLGDLKQNRNEWFWALSYLTQSNPIKPADAGKMDRMIEAWVEWGREHNFI
jgi:hypothetical protein